MAQICISNPTFPFSFRLTATHSHIFFQHFKFNMCKMSCCFYLISCTVPSVILFPHAPPLPPLSQQTAALFFLLFRHITKLLLWYLPFFSFLHIVHQPILSVLSPDCILNSTASHRICSPNPCTVLHQPNHCTFVTFPLLAIFPECKFYHFAPLLKNLLMASLYT